MRFKLPLLALIFSVGINLGTAMTASSQSGVFSLPESAVNSPENSACWLLGLPQITQTFDDLDPRDCKNQTITASVAQEELKELFSTGLYNLLTLKKIYTTNEIAGLLAQALNLGKDFISKDIPVFFGKFVYAILPSQKKKSAAGFFNALPGFLIFPIIIIFGINSYLINAGPTSDKAFLVLRC
jgi:hypothetical protein